MRKIPRKVAVIGTSNSIMKAGWFPLAQKASTEHGLSLTNFSLGGCPSIYAAHAMYRHSLARNYDLLVFDFCVNDLMVMQSGILTIEHTIAYHAALIRELLLSDALDKAVIAMFPMRDTCGKPEQRTYFDVLIRLFQEFGVKYIDFDAEVVSWAQHEQRPIVDAFFDWAHFSPDYASVVSERILQVLQSAKMLPDENVKSLKPPEISLSCLSLHTNVSRIRLGTSLVGFPVMTFEEGETFRLHGDKYLVGFLHWHHENSSSLVFHGVHGKRRAVMRRGWHKMFRCDPIGLAIEVLGGLDFTVGNDKTVNLDSQFGVSNTIFDSTGGTADVIDFIGCNVDPARFGGVLIRDLMVIAPVADPPPTPVAVQPSIYRRLRRKLSRLRRYLWPRS
jgi:hypothetical protein